MTLHQLEREIRVLRIYAAGLTVLLLGVAFTARSRAQDSKQRFAEIDVERVNVVDADGRIALIIANRERLPGPMMSGRELARSASQGREGSAGMLFVDRQGNEVGGLTYAADVQPGGRYTADASLTFDQHDQDQVVGLQYVDADGMRSSGLNVWDRPTTISLQQMLEAIAGATDANDRRQRLRALADQHGVATLGPRRAFLGSENRTATLRLIYTTGRERFRVSVDDTGAARLEFVDDAGKVVYSLPPK